MKLFYLKIPKVRTAGMTQFLWPDWWSEFYQLVDYLGYEDTGELGQVKERILILAADDVAEKIKAKAGEDYQEATLTDADAFMQEFEGRTLAERLPKSIARKLGLIS
jgi:hypothetical protein